MCEQLEIFSGLKPTLSLSDSRARSLSVAGKRRGLAGDRSGLFFEAMRIIRELKPQYFIFEKRQRFAYK